jgi:hypothetical protein
LERSVYEPDVATFARVGIDAAAFSAAVALLAAFVADVAAALTELAIELALDAAAVALLAAFVADVLAALALVVA